MDDEYTSPTFPMLGWVRNLIGFYEARDLVAFDTLKQVPAWLDAGSSGRRCIRGLEIPASGPRRRCLEQVRKQRIVGAGGREAAFQQRRHHGGRP